MVIFPDMTSALDSGSVAPRRTLLDLAAGGTLLLAVAGATWWLSRPAATFGVAVAALYAALGAAIVVRPPPARGSGLGPANRITLVRAALTIVAAGLLLDPESLDGVTRWWVIGIGTLVLVLDGFDGRVARRTNTTTAWGARFDMETDAALMLVLAALVWVSGRAGAWVLLIGAMRYLFVAAGWVVPALRAPLFDSLRRKVVCVVQGIALLVALGPIIPDAAAVAAAAIALAALTWSFGVDTLWLLRHDARPDPAA